MALARDVSQLPTDNDAEQAYLAADVNAEIIRVLTIYRYHGLSPEVAAHVLNSISRQRSWSHLHEVDPEAAG
jgi:hypothetical protein